MVGQVWSPLKELQPWTDWLAGLVLPACFFVMVCAQPVGAQVSGHQRLGVQPQAYWEVDFEWVTRLSPVGYSDYGLPVLESSLSIGLLLGRKWSAGLFVPVRISGWLDGTAPVLFIPGDTTASVGWTTLRGDNRVRGVFNLTGPSAHWQGNQQVPGSATGGSGRWTAGLSGSLAHIIDPLVLGGMLSWSIGLPRTERWDSLWRPGDFSLVLSVTEVFNERVSCTAVLSQYVSLPEAVWGAPLWKPSYAALGYDASAGIRFLVSGRSLNVGIGISKGIIQSIDPGSVDLSLGYILRQGKGP